MVTSTRVIYKKVLQRTQICNLLGVFFLDVLVFKYVTYLQPIPSGVASALKGGRHAHPEDQNKENLRKSGALVHPGLWGWLRPAHSSVLKVIWLVAYFCDKVLVEPGGGGYSVQKTLQGCAANMGSKISLLVWMTPYKMQN